MTVASEKIKTAPAKVEQKEVKQPIEAKPLGKVLDTVKQPTAIDRIKRAEQFEILSKRHQHLTEKKTELDKFLISDDGTQGVTMFLEMGNKTFEISNNGVIKELLTYAKTKLNSLIEVSEAEVLNFTI